MYSRLSLLLISSFIALSCRASVKDPDTSGTSTDSEPEGETDETGDSSIIDDPSGFDVAVSTSEVISTVVIVDWRFDQDLTAAHVEFGADESYGRVATATLQTEGPQRTLLLGLKPDSTWHLRVVGENDDGAFTSADHIIETGPAPAALPNLDVESSGDHWGGYLVTGIVGSPPGPVILDPDGDYVWWYEAEDTGGSGPGPGGSVVLGRSHLALDGSAMLYTYNNVQGDEDNAIYSVSMDGLQTSSRSTPLGHHDFVELPDGTIAYLAYDPRTVGREQVMGDRVMELAPDGTITEIFNIWDYFDYTSSGDSRGMNWPHANAIDYLPEEDAYIVGFLTIETLIKVDRSTGQPLWILGGSESDFTLDGSTDFFTSQHQFHQLEDSILVFVNGGMEPGAQSRVVEVQFDEGEPAAEVTWEYWPSPSINCTNLGDVERLDSGNTLVTFSLSGEIHEVDSSGELVWKLSADLGGALSYSTLKENLDVGSW